MISMASGTLKRIVAFRLSPGEDILGGLKNVCDKYGIRSGVIISGIGSLDGASFHDVEALPGTKAGYGYGDVIIHTEPIELISASGSICEGESGEALFHVHCCFSDQKGNAYGGHLIEGNKVLLTADFVIGEFEGISMDRRFDEELGVFLIKPSEV
ncbi:MAG: DNA-binding protein [Clostridia bacterium]|nr:DNA-binding protein [Clostridia bacterium]